MSRLRFLAQSSRRVLEMRMLRQSESRFTFDELPNWEVVTE